MVFSTSVLRNINLQNILKMAHILDAISRSYVRTDPSMYDQYETQVFQAKPKRHSGIVNCPHCDYTTHRISILKRHLLVHKRPEECIMYKCPSCQYQTKYKNQLPNHIRLVHLKDKKPGVPGPKRKKQSQESSSDGFRNTRSRQKIIDQEYSEQKRKKSPKTDSEASDEEMISEKIESGLDLKLEEEENRTASRGSEENKEIISTVSREEKVIESSLKENEIINVEDEVDDKEREGTPDDGGEIKNDSEKAESQKRNWFYRCSGCEYKTFKRLEVQRHTNSEKLRKGIHKAGKPEIIMYCNLCNYGNTDENIFKQHQQIHQKPKPTVWLCEVCSHQANSRRNLREHHIRFHRPKPEKVLTKCTFCDYRSFWRDAVKKHIDMVHNDPENILMNICDICGHQTKYKNNFKRHMATHKDLSKLSDNEKYTCNICYFETHDKYTLKKHLKKQKCSRETADSMLKCPHCNFKAWNKGDITKHSIIHNKDQDNIPQKMYTCHLCQYTSKWKSHVHRHVKNFHGKELEGRKRLPKNIIVETICEVPKEEPDFMQSRGMPFDALWTPLDAQKPVIEPVSYRSEPQISLYPKPSYEDQVLRRGPPVPPADPNAKLFELNFDNLLHDTNFIANPPNKFDEPTSSYEDVKNETNSISTPNPTSMDSGDEQKEPDYIELQTPNPVFNNAEEHNMLPVSKVETCFDEKSQPTNDDLLETVKEEKPVVEDVKNEIKTEDSEVKDTKKKRKSKKSVKRKTKKGSKGATPKKKPKKETNKEKETDEKKEPISKSAIGQARFNRSFKCSLCGYQNVHRSMVARHVKIHIKHGQTDVEIIKVNGVRFNSVSNKNLMKKSYKCSACGYKHLVRTMVKRHQQTHLRKKETNLDILLVCGHCDFEHLEQYVLKKHYLMEHRVLKCHVCTYETKSRRELQAHITNHRKNDELEMTCCEICGFKTSWRDSLKKHMLVHKAPEETTWYCCEVCAFQTKHKNNLKEHLLTHKDSREVETYRCPHCEFETKHKWRLKKHLRLKCNPEGCEMNYKCEHCNFKAYNKADIEKHAASHVGEEIFSCTLCDYKTIVKRNFKRHALVSHQKK